VGQKAPETAKTIPGPSWLWLEPIYEPFRAYGRVQQRKPYMTQLISSLVVYFVGDMVAQSIAEPAPRDTLGEEGEEMGWVQEWSANRDWHRTGRSLIIGGLSSIPAYRWFLWLSNSFNYSSKMLSITVKVCFTPKILT
jgi:protein Mpv17